MSDIRDPRLLYFKGGLLLLTGLVAAGLLLADRPTLRTAFLLALAIWAFCRAYYFTFYVIQHYIDPNYKFAGLGSVAAYLWRRRSKANKTPVSDSPTQAQ